jgi:hypothetical protein
MKKSELQQIIKEEIRKVLKEASSKSTTNAKDIKTNFEDRVEGFYVVKGGHTGGKWHESKVKTWLLFTPDFKEATQDKYIKDGYTRVEIARNGNIDISNY